MKKVFILVLALTLIAGAAFAQPKIVIGALIRNLDVLLSEECALPVFVAENPLHAVVDGVGTVLENLPKYKRLLL